MMQGVGTAAACFLMLLWVFIWSVLRILKTFMRRPAVAMRRGLALRTLLGARQRWRCTLPGGDRRCVDWRVSR